MPIRKISTVRFTIFPISGHDGLNSNLRREMYVDIPMMNMKKGNTRSVGVRPFHWACWSGAYVPGPPELFTMIMPAMVMPRMMSRARILELFFFAGVIVLVAVDILR